MNCEFPGGRGGADPPVTHFGSAHALCPSRFGNSLDEEERAYSVANSSASFH